MKRSYLPWIAGAVLLVLAALIWRSRTARPGAPLAYDSLVLLIPDDVKATDPRVTVWLDAGREEGLHLTPLSASDLFRPSMARQKFAGIILPDKVHVAMSDTVVEKLRQYVQDGGNLLLTFDAGTWTEENAYAKGKSRFSDMVGVDYAYYEQLREKTISIAPVWAKPDVITSLEFPPGKCLPISTDVRKQRSADGTLPPASALTIAGYDRDHLDYPGFQTRGSYRGKTLLGSRNGLAAGISSFGKGQVLFVNLPLGYLKGRTDGLLLHSFLRYFAEKVVLLPRIGSVPDGVGGMIMNWHVDSNADVKYVLTEMNRLNIYTQKPYSIHITAGPDARKIGDGLGVNVRGDQRVQKWLRETAAIGHGVGSHGGWIHDYFGTNLSETRTDQMQEFLELNKAALEEATGKPVTEYSAPQGNQPPWVTQWLAEQKIVGYYFTGNTGMAPTRNYREGKLEVPKYPIWAFPVTNFGTSGSFEEMRGDRVSEAQVGRWLQELVDFCGTHRTSRLVYFHPNGTRYYPNAMRAWLAHTANRQKQNRFRWYTMSNLAPFLQQRDEVQWKVAVENNIAVFDASHAKNLTHQNWSLPAARFGEPKVTQGKATVRRDGPNWLVVAGEGRSLRFQSTTR
ncbi:MAG TPA: polysaccharide deacetylase family protein [Abditibacteriaceae bacterium]|jgi:hypothetical protein